MSAALAIAAPRKRLRAHRKSARAYDLRGRHIVFGNALGNSIVGAIQHSSNQEKLKSAFEKAGVGYRVDDRGDIVANSQASNAAAHALLANGASAQDIAAILGNDGLKNAFNSIDATNAAIDGKALNSALDSFSQQGGSIAGFASGPQLGALTPIPLDEASAAFLAGRSPAAVSDGLGNAVDRKSVV